MGGRDVLEWKWRLIENCFDNRGTTACLFADGDGSIEN